jgi:hypothetical protein
MTAYAISFARERVVVAADTVFYLPDRQAAPPRIVGYGTKIHPLAHLRAAIFGRGISKLITETAGLALPEDDHRRKKIQAGMDNIGVKIDRLEDQIFEWITNHPSSPAVLLACLNMLRDWVWLRREPMVDAVIASARSLLADAAKKGGAA